MAKRPFEDFTPGMVIEHGPRLVTREEIVAFALGQPQAFDDLLASMELARG